MSIRLFRSKKQEVGTAGDNFTINKAQLKAIIEDIELNKSRIEKFDCQAIDRSGFRYKLELIYSINIT